MTPKCCKNCKHLLPSGACAWSQACSEWRKWFSREWNNIRKAAALIKERREYKQDKLDELRREYKEKEG